MTVKSLDGGPLDNLKLNEFLGSVTLNGSGVSVGMLGGVGISATDTDGLTGSDRAGTLVDVGLLGLLNRPAPAIHSGTSDNDVIDGTTGDDRMYGYAGDDVINAGNGNDLLRGGAGNDVLNGGSGNDVLIGGAGNDRLTGGAGIDIFRWEVEGTDGTGGNGRDTITDFRVGADGDKLDVSRLLIGYFKDIDGPAHTVNGVPRIDAGDTIGDYLSVTHSGGDTVISIDRDGSGTRYSSETLMTLSNVTTDLATLLMNQQLLV